MASERDDIALLCRRAGFGGRPEEIDAATAAGYEATVDRLLSSDGADPGLAGVPDPTLTAPDLRTLADPTARQALNATLASERRQLTAWWLVRMASAASP